LSLLVSDRNLGCCAFGFGSGLTFENPQESLDEYVNTNRKNQKIRREKKCFLFVRLVAFLVGGFNPVEKY